MSGRSGILRRMDDGAADLEKAAAQAPGLERFLRGRLVNTSTFLFLVVVLVGGIISASTPGSHFLETASICLFVAAACAGWLVARYLLLVRRLRNDPVSEIAKLHRKRSIKKAGFVDEVQSSVGQQQFGEGHQSDPPASDAYGLLRDIDILGQKSADGVNRTDDPSRGPIE